MPQTITDGAERQISLSSILFSANAANFRPAKSRLITTVRAIAHVTSVRVESGRQHQRQHILESAGEYVSGTARPCDKTFCKELNTNIGSSSQGKGSSKVGLYRWHCCTSKL